MITPPPPTIIFLHIPKTAGTTLSEILKRHYRHCHPAEIYNGEFSSEEGMTTFMNLPLQRRAGLRLLWGHFPFGLHQHLPGTSTYFTFLRDPVERVISHYYFLRSRPDLFWVPEEIKQKNLTFHEVLERDMIVDIKNMQTRLLAGLPYLFPVDQYTEQHLETAKQNLRDYFSVVGLVERYDESLLLLKQAFGWENIYYVQENINRQRPPREAVPPKTIELIKQKNDLDMKLYTFAQEHFAGQLAQAGVSFSRNVRWFQFRNRALFGPMIKIKRLTHQSHKSIRTTVHSVMVSL